MIAHPFFQLQDGPVALRDVRCSVSDLSGGAEVLVLAEDASIDADAWRGRLETVGDRLAVGRDDGTDLVGLLEVPPDGQQPSVTRAMIDEMSKLSAHQGVVIDGGTAGFGESRVDDVRRLVVVWSSGDTDPDDVEDQLRAALTKSSVADRLEIDDAEFVRAAEVMVAASIPIKGDARVMREILNRADVLLTSNALD